MISWTEEHCEQCGKTIMLKASPAKQPGRVVPVEPTEFAEKVSTPDMQSMPSSKESDWKGPYVQPHISGASGFVGDPPDTTPSKLPLSAIRLRTTATHIRAILGYRNLLGDADYLEEAAEHIENLERVLLAVCNGDPLRMAEVMKEKYYE